jgi:hypothetical protein
MLKIKLYLGRFLTNSSTMKKITFLTTILLVFTAITFVSCEVESIDPALSNNGANNGGNTGGGNTGGGTGGNGGTSSGDYWPTAINNIWNYDQDGNATEMKIIGTDNFNGGTYYKFSPQSGFFEGNGATDVTTWIHKNGGNYIMKMGDLNINAGGLTGTQTGSEMVMLKDNIAVNATWSGSYTQTTTYSILPTSIVMTTNYTGKILEKDATVTVNGVTYTNVIKMNLRQVVSTMGANTVTDLEYWFAKDIGPIRAYMNTEGNIFETKLTSYTLN